MVDPIELALDISSSAVPLAIPALGWLALFLLAWERPTFAEALGLGSRTFWLLFVGSILGWLANLPIAMIEGSLLAVDLSGAAFPFVIAALLIARLGRGSRRASWAAALGFAAFGSAVIALLVVAPPWAGSVGAIAGVGAVSAALAVALARAPGRSFSQAVPATRLAIWFVLTVGVSVTTYALATPSPGVGVSEPYPLYLLPPVAVGVLAVAIWPAGPDRAFGLPIAYASSALGVLVGADVWRQPGLYGAGTVQLYSIGGAGILDLVYLSPLLALLAALATYWFVDGRWRLPSDTVVRDGPPRLDAAFSRAFDAGARGEIRASIEASCEAARLAAVNAHRLLASEPAGPDPWNGLDVPSWVHADFANLSALAKSGSDDTRDGIRAYLAARGLAGIATRLVRRRYAKPSARIVAFLIDLAIVTGPAAALWVAITASTGGSLDRLLSSPTFLAAAYGYPAAAFLYFALGDRWTGQTIGKAAMRIAVRDRALERPSLLASLVRESTKLALLTVVGIGGALAVALAWHGAGGLAGGDLTTSVGALPAILVGATVAAGTALLGAIGLLIVLWSDERQRLGDRFAGTWVVTSRPTATRPSPAPPPEPRPAPVPEAAAPPGPRGS